MKRKTHEDKQNWKHEEAHRCFAMTGERRRELRRGSAASGDGEITGEALRQATVRAQARRCVRRRREREREARARES